MSGPQRGYFGDQLYLYDEHHYLLLIAANVLLGVRTPMIALFAGVALWGLHVDFTQGIFAAMVAESAPSALRGTAFGVVNLASSVCMVLSSAIAGWI